MNLKEIQEYIDENYQVDEFISWQPSEYEMKYRYNTPRRQKKIESDRSKIDEGRREVIHGQEHQKEVLKSNCKRISEVLPEDVASLFFTTIKWNIEDMVTAHINYMECHAKLKSKYYKEGDYCCIYVYLNRMQYCLKSGELILDEFKKQFESCLKKDDSILNKDKLDELCSDYLEFHRLQKNDIVCLKYGDLKIAKRNELNNIVAKLLDVCNNIRDVLDKKKIVDWSREHNWGVGGYYNGILINEVGKKVSFKSFVAGGYNIQRRHIRCRLTVLK